jgi:hypothetical protein
VEIRPRGLNGLRTGASQSVGRRRLGPSEHCSTTAPSAPGRPERRHSLRRGHREVWSWLPSASIPRRRAACFPQTTGGADGSRLERRWLLSRESCQSRHVRAGASLGLRAGATRGGRRASQSWRWEGVATGKSENGEGARLLNWRERESLTIVPDELVLLRPRAARITEHIAAVAYEIEPIAQLIAVEPRTAGGQRTAAQ